MSEISADMKPSSGSAQGQDSKTPSSSKGPFLSRIVRRVLGAIVIIGIAAIGYFGWQHYKPKGLGPDFFSGNGRLEATELDIAAKSGGRITDILVNDGDFIAAGQVVAHVDTDVLQAQLQQANAQEAEARNAVEAALSTVRQRQSEVEAAEAVVVQRQAEEFSAEKTAERTKVLSEQHAASLQEYEDNLARQKGSAAAVLAAKAQVAAARATNTAATSQVLQARSRVEAAIATENRLKSEIADNELKAARAGRVQFRIAQPGEVVSAGGKILSTVDLNDVYMTIFLPETIAGRTALGAEVRIVLDAAPEYVIPAKVSFVANVAQFTPKTVETESERQKLVFRVKARIDPELLRSHISQVKSGLPGVAYVRLNDSTPWPDNLKVRVTK